MKRHRYGFRGDEGGQARKGEPRFKTDDMTVQSVRINLEYERADLKTILRYARVVT